MKKNLKIIIIIVFVLVSLNSISQHKYDLSYNYKYGVKYLDLKNKNDKENLKRYLYLYKNSFSKNDNLVSYDDRLGDIKIIIGLKWGVPEIKLEKDTLKSIFKIKRIEKKTNNWQLINDEIIRRTIYLIDVTPLDQTSSYPSYIRIISLEPLGLKSENKIKVGDKLEMTLLSHFENDFWPWSSQNVKKRYHTKFPQIFFISKFGL